MATTPDPFSYAAPELAGINRQREMAKLLLQQGQNQPQGQMVSGRYVAPSFFQHLAPAFATWAGNRKLEQADIAEQKALENARAQEAEDINQYNRLRAGQAAVPAQEAVASQELAGPTQGNTPLMSGAIEGRAGQEAIAPNPAAAFNYALTSRSPILRKMAIDKLQGRTLSEGQIFQEFDPVTGKYETTAQGNEKFHAPITVQSGDRTLLVDPRNPSKVLGSYANPKERAGQVYEGENGPVLIDTRTGTSRPILDANGQPISTSGKPLTAEQSKDTGYYGRMKEADKILEDLAKGGTEQPGWIKTKSGEVAGSVPIVGGILKTGTDFATNWTQSNKEQQVEQAQLNFITAVLRRESGAAISAGEYETERKKYFPQPGDSAEVVQQKKRAREDAIEAVRISAGPGAKQWDRRQEQRTAAPPNSPAAQNNPAKAVPTAKDNEAIAWARANPNDPNAKAILQANGLAR